MESSPLRTRSQGRAGDAAAIDDDALGEGRSTLNALPLDLVGVSSLGVDGMPPLPMRSIATFSSPFLA